MKQLILTFILSIVLVSCETKTDKAFTVKSDTVVTKTSSEFSDPALMAGSSFGNFFISALRTQNYDLALKFTSKGSIEKFGIKAITEKYKDFKFNYKLSQKSKTVDGDTITMVYSTNEYATGKLKKMILVLENDSCKLVLPNNLAEFLD